ncbi:MAG: type II secretion system secretin GspD [Nevskiaceae bacterium]|jgi:general secretion pathway protein D|nr:type II secretion system secretin GspD [Nevskiaceae bacterium]
MTRRPRHTLRAACIAALLCVASHTAWTAAAPAQRITVNFRDTDIATVTESVATATGRTFIIDPRVRAQVNLISSTPMTPNEFYQAFLSVLQVNGFAAVPSGNVIKIVMQNDVRTVPGNDLPQAINAGADEVMTQVVTVRNTNAAQLAQVLRPLIAQYGNIAPVPGTNTLIITDRAANVNRILRIINRVDQVGDANIEVVPLQNSTAADVVRTLTALIGPQGAEAAGGAAPKIVADERSNSILISGDSAQRLRIATLIAHLDTPLEDGGDTRVRYLRFADAEKLAPKLQEQLSGIAAATPGAGGAAAAAGAGATSVGGRTTMIWPEPETNALIITAPPKMMRSINTIIDQLDIRRAQVQVEAIIVDVSTNKSADLGVNWAVLDNGANATVPTGGFITPVGGSSIVDLASGIRGIANGDAAAAAAAGISVPQGTTIGIGKLVNNGVSFAAMIRALRADDNTNVIATPNVVTMDNQEAELENAQEVPFITGQYASTGTAGAGNFVNPFTTIQREKVGLLLKVTPQITNEGDTLVMKIELESSELTGAAGDAGSLITQTRAVKTNVLIDDGGTIVIGGLIRDTERQGENRVPFLSRIPLVGEAFRARNNRREQSNLMIFIRPTILADSVQSAVETNAKYNQIRERQRQMNSKFELIPLLPGTPSPELPEAPPLPDPTAPAPQVADGERLITPAASPQ